MADIDSTINNGVNAVTNLVNQSDTNIANEMLSKVPFIGDNKALQALLLLVSFIILAKIFLWFSKKFIRRLIRKTKTDLDDKLIDISEKPIAGVLVLIGIKLALVPLNITGSYKIVIAHFINSLIIIAIFYSFSLIANALIDVWGKNFAKKTKTKVDNELLPLVHKTVKVILFILGILFILKEWDINITPILASLGIAGLAVGLALQPTLSNIFAGIALILDRTFKKGDIIEIEGITGIIEDIGLRTTKIKTFDNDIVTVPNNSLATSKIINHLLPDLKARFNVKVSVAYGTKVEKVKEIIMNQIKNNKRILKDPNPAILFSEMGDFALKLDVYAWVDDFAIKGVVKDELTTAIYNALNKNKIEIPYPAYSVYRKE